MEKGMFLKDLNQTAKPCTIERLGDRTFRIILTQGLNRQIRRMCSAVGHEVRTLKRVRVVNIELGALRPGQQRKIEGEELEALYRAVMPVKKQTAAKDKTTGKRKNG
jgi:23S rRNA pseudouridine2604 synthase